MKYKSTCLDCGWRHESNDFRDSVVTVRNHLIVHGENCKIVVITDKNAGYVSARVDDDGHLKLKWTDI